jgi:hydrogenase maturation protein HypF
MNDDLRALKIEVRGIVQGVGFRPFVYRLADQHALKGTVANTSTGVIIHIEGPLETLDAFCSALRSQPPPLAEIIDFTSRTAAPQGFDHFSILPSIGHPLESTLVSPDTAICDDCLREMRDPADRRFAHPFINCTHCGPRYTIIEEMPYDRINTTMKRFRMCEHCRVEYEDPSNRRFHAQPIACPACGPTVTLLDAHGRNLTDVDPIGKAASLLKEGRILSIKGLGGFHLAVDAENDPAVQRLRERKHRPHKPFALMSKSIEIIDRYAHITPETATVLLDRARPIVLIEQRAVHPLSNAVAPGSPYFGVMLPYTPLHYLILDAGFTALVMTSGNRSGEPLCIDTTEALAELSGIADYFLTNDRPVHQRCDDSIVQYSDGSTRLVRRARGYVPLPIHLPYALPPILACGAELKNTLCLAQDKTAFISQHLGDMEALSTIEFFTDAIDHTQKLSKIGPQIVAHDLHPDYLSTQYAKALTGVRCIGVQHHHAHVISCMAENRIDGPVIGIALDGTGFGTDGAVWGGEVLVAERADFTRWAHLAYVPMPGGTAAIREPWRMAFSYLYRVFGEEMTRLNLPLFNRIPPQKTGEVIELLRKQIRSPMTSSMGRLFDGIAALVDLCDRVTFEGQAAMALETIAGGRWPDDTTPYSWEIDMAHSPWQLPIDPLVRGVISDLGAGKTARDVSRRFHLTVIHLFNDLCVRLRKATGLSRVVLSGGVFQNKLLLEGMVALLRSSGFSVHIHRIVPTNDGGISLGQAVAAAAMAENNDRIKENRCPR